MKFGLIHALTALLQGKSRRYSSTELTRITGWLLFYLWRIFNCRYCCNQGPAQKQKKQKHMPIKLYSFIHQWFYSLLLGPGFFYSVVIFFTQTVGLLGWGISRLQGRYLHTGQHKYRINAHKHIHALSGIRTHDSSVRASEESSCLRPRGHCDRQWKHIRMRIRIMKCYKLVPFSRHYYMMWWPVFDWQSLIV
jgi:hypothetical protein